MSVSKVRSKVQFAAEPNENHEPMMKKPIARMPTPRVKMTAPSRRSFVNRASYGNVLTEAAKNLQKGLQEQPNCDKSDQESEPLNPSSFETPVRWSLVTPQVQNEESSESENEESVNGTVINYANERSPENIGERDMNQGHNHSGKKKATALTGNSWHKQLRRRLSVSNPRRQSDSKFQTINKVDFSKEKTRRSHAPMTAKTPNISAKLIKSDAARRMSIKLVRAKPGDYKIRRSVTVKLPDQAHEPETKRSQLSNLNLSSQSLKRNNLLPKKTVPLLVNTDKGVIVKNEEVLYFGIPLDQKKKNTKPIPFSFEARNKERLLKKEQKLKSLNQPTQKQIKPNPPPINAKTIKPSPIKIVKKVDSKPDVIAKVNIPDKSYGTKRQSTLGVNTNTNSSKDASKRPILPQQNNRILDDKNKKKETIKENISPSPNSQATAADERLKKFASTNKDLLNEISQLKLELEKAKNQNNTSKETLITQQNIKVEKLEEDVESLRSTVSRLEEQVESLITANIFLQKYLNLGDTSPMS